MVKTIIRDLYRGDNINIPIEAELTEGSIYRAQLRNTPESEQYFTLLIEDNQIKITPEQSENLTEGTWYTDLEENTNGVISTIQSTTLVIKNDVTRTYGDAAPEWETNQSVEVAEIISKNYYLRLPSGELAPVAASAYDIAVSNGFEGTDTEWLASLQGEQGIKGDTGEQGIQGIQGEQGVQGDQGIQGIQGEDGISAYEVAVENGFIGTESEWLDSLVGEQGIQGIQGEQGIQGLQGIQGIQGEQGLTGNEGLSAYEVWLNLENTGTEQDFIDSLQGEQGIQGIQGVQGLTGDQGIQGEDGISAYEVAVNNGFVGTETEWLESLKGLDGEGAGDMLASVYDPSNISSNAFDMDNMIEGTNNKLVSQSEKDIWNAKQDSLTADSDYLTPNTASNTYEPLKGTDDNYVTDAEKTILSNTSGTNSGDQDLSIYDTHIADNTIHFTQSQISITESQISDLANYLTSESDPIFTASQAANITASDITNLSNLSGINTGDQDLSSYDSHLADSSIHFTQSQISITESQISDFKSYALASSVLTDVPLGAVFTDTTYSIGDGGLTEVNFTSVLNSKLSGIEANANNYTHPASHPISLITGLQDSLDNKVDNSRVLTDVPANALFTDTVYTLPFTDNSDNWNTAYSWGDHAGLYESIDSTILRSADIGISVQAFNSNITVQGVISLSSLGFTGDLDANYYVHPTSHPISLITGLQTALDSKVDDSQVLTDVPVNALFTDTTYSVGNGGLTEINFTSTLKTKLDGIEEGANNYSLPTDVVQDSSYVHTDNNYTTTEKNKLSGVEEGATADQTKADIDLLGVDASTVNGLTVETAVPSGAVFTDTVYTHPASHPISMITNLQSTLDNKSDITHDHSGVYEPVFSKNTAFNKDFGTSSDTVCEGNDSRITYETISIACSDETSDLEAGTVVEFTIPFGMTLTEVRASVNTAPSSSTLIVDINENGTSILSTKLSIDSGEKISATASTQAVISDSTLTENSTITIDIDQVGTITAGTGLKVYLTGQRT